MNTHKIRDGAAELAIVVRASDWEPGLQFVSAPEDFQQVGAWWYDKGKTLQPHIHLEAHRRASHTQEVLFVVQGKVRATVFSEDRKPVEVVELGQGDAMVLLRGGHGYEILEDDTKVIEIKNGPYPGPERDRERIG